MAERDGSGSHDLFRLPGYVTNLRVGFVDGRAVPEVKQTGAAFLRVDARRGFARPALDQVFGQATDIARSVGACIIAIGNSFHYGPLWLDVEPFTEHGLIALTVVNSVTYVVPHGAKRAVCGTNPMTFGVPRAGKDALIFDQSTATMANGEVRVAAREGRMLLEGTGLDAQGNPTGDPAAILDGGALLPFGGHKGSSIAIMIDLLAGAPTGTNFSHEVDWTGYPDADMAHTGQFLLVVDPQKSVGSLLHFTTRVEDLVKELVAAGQSRLPGDHRLAARRRAGEKGIAIDSSTWDMLSSLSGAWRLREKHLACSG
jgi:delta1-piperideine-2-carboxylate reductase